MEHVVILGGGYGGLACALRLAGRARGRVRVTLVEGRPRFVERIRLHQQAASERSPERDLAALVRGTGVELRTGWASAIDPEAHTVTVGSASLGVERLRYDRLVLALGSRTDVDSVPGVREHALTLDAGRADELGRAVRSLAARGGRVVVVGGGLTGIETAAELAEANPRLAVTLLTRGPVAEGWSVAARAHVLAAFARLGVALREGVEVRGVEADRVVTDGDPARFDLCVWSVGFTCPPLAGAAGLAVNDRGQVRVDGCLRAISHRDVYAAGDIASPIEPPGDPIPMGCKSAEPMGAFVGENLARIARGAPEEALDYAVPGYCVSLGRRDGVIQLMRRGGSPTGAVITGRRAAWVKELVCRSTLWALELERRGIPAVRWMRTGRVPALEARSVPLLPA